jgi:hypothetical protein
MVRNSVKKQRKDALPVVRTREIGTEVTGSGSNDVETSSRRVIRRNKSQNHITNARSLGDIRDSAKVYYGACALMAETGGASDEPDPTSTKEALEGPYSKEWQDQPRLEPHFIQQPFHMVYVSTLQHSSTMRSSDNLKDLCLVECLILFALCCAFSLHIHQKDVHTAFLYAPLEEDIYMVPPTGMVGIPWDHCLKLKNSLYGLKQAPTNLNHLIDEFIIGLGFVKCVLNNCLYLMSFSNVSKVIC